MRVAGLLMALVALWLLVAPGNALADVRDTDRVGAVELSANPAIHDAAPDVECNFGALMATDGTILWQRDANVQVPMASTTKIMVALVVLDLGSPSDLITVSANAASMEGSTAYLAAGDELTMEQLLYAMLLPSGNDAAVALAEHYAGGDIYGFVALMNAKAAELGMNSTHFSNPSGIEDVDNYTTANDYLKLVAKAMSNRLFRTVVATPEYTYDSTARGVPITVASTNMLLGEYDGAIGVKTGHTDAAGYCFIGAAERDGIGLYSVVLDSPDMWSRFQDTINLWDWGFAHYRRALLLDSQTVVGNAVATSWLDKLVPVVAKEDAYGLVFDYEPDLVQEIDIHDREGVIDRGSAMGTVRWLRNGEVVAQVNLVSSENVDAPSIIESMQIWWHRFAGFFTGDVLSVEQNTLLGDTYPLGSLTGATVASPVKMEVAAPAEPVVEEQPAPEAPANEALPEAA